ncbi:parvulin-like peptidyl-prolyl isomerase [Orenia metallireducens]|uniref:Parvulin-like peptidyl-prolyl isomerase n=1 Tax=Orenia metallireducens TaxID=1413210 RepID=A0A285G8M0_9FIRM|nr:peptidylprolyl isomerase [Orenia metallireducens]PRX24217.1 parvulin-like peptidyl-prolyl isomerase [Orenia metallireducens]SNY19815.1 Parvulin-like peptidyl-prolyl isomerase [Orenia metallireducens]
MMDLLRKHTKAIIYVVVVAFVATGALVYLNTPGTKSGAQQEAYAQRFDKAVATVNGEEIPYQEYAYQLQGYLRQYQNQIAPNQVVGLKANILDNIINQKLILQEAKKNDIKPEITDEDVQAQLDQVIDYYASSKEEFEEIIKKNGQTIEDVKNTIRENMATQKRIEAMLDSVKDNIEVTDQEIAKQYEEVTASHILIKTDDKEDAEAKAKAEEVLAKAKSGEDFAKLAKEYSEGPSSSRGGNLGSFTRGRMVKPFEEAAFSMEVGEISDLVKTEFGYHIIKVTDKKEATGKEFEEKKEEIKEKLVAQKEKEAVNNWLEEVRDNAKIVIEDKEIKAFDAARNGNLETAINNYKAAIANNQGAYYLYHNLAQIYQMNGNQEEAISTYQEAIENYPEQVDFYVSLADLYTKDEKFDKAIEVYQTGLSNNEDNAELHLSLGDAYRKQDNNEKALEEYETFSKLAGDDLMAQYRLANIYSQMGLEDKAKAQMDKVKEIQSKQQEAAKQEREESKKEETKEESAE